MRTLITGFVALFLASLPAPARAGGPTRCTGPLADNELRVYQYPDYVGTCLSWTLDDGERQVLVQSFPRSQLGNRTGSLQLGSKVSVSLFDRERFVENKPYWRLFGPEGWHELFTSNTKKLPKRTLHQVRSLILFPRGLPYPRGVMLVRYTRAYKLDPTSIANPRWTQFFPLPQQARARVARYDVDRRLNDASDYLQFHMCFVGSATLYRDPRGRGRSVTFPGATGCKRRYTLRDYGMAHTVSSVSVSELRRR
jgi:hypothetical protein